MPNTREAVQRCIDRCARAKDGRGRWRAEADCAAELAVDGDARIAADTAAVSRRIGEWLAAWPNVNPNAGA